MIEFISAQPGSKYYAWQTDVYINNFINNGVYPHQINVVVAYDDSIEDCWINLSSKYDSVKFFFYKDTRENKIYQPSVQPHILKKHFLKHPENSEKTFFYHDCDMIFTRKMSFNKFLKDDNWYFSNVDGYLGADYLTSKGNLKPGLEGEFSLLDGMAKHVGICPCLVRANAGNSGGAQKIIKKVDHTYWDDVEKYSLSLYEWLKTNKDKYGDGEANDIQIWTASMWAELWLGWKRGKNIVTVSDLDFCWATDGIMKWHLNGIYHNAGVTRDGNGMFYKQAYEDKLPFDIKPTDFRADLCSHKYVEEILKVKDTNIFDNE